MTLLPSRASKGGGFKGGGLLDLDSAVLFVIFQKNPRAHKNEIALPPPPNPKYPPP